MSVSFNKVIVAGNLTRDPELRFTKGGVPVCGFGLAVNDKRSKREDAVDFFDITAWRELGEVVANYKRKGDPILVEGKLQHSSWESDDGQKRSKVSIVAHNVQFLGGSRNGDGGGSPSGSAGSGAGGKDSGSGRRGSSEGSGVVAADDEDFDDIPFAHRQPTRVVF